MNFSAYRDIADDAPDICRQNERELLLQANRMLTAVQNTDPANADVIDAVNHVQQIWLTFIRDLATPGNELPGNLRSELTQIGVWIWQAGNRVVAGEMRWIPDIIRLNREIADGLRTSEAA